MSVSITFTSVEDMSFYKEDSKEKSIFLADWRVTEIKLDCPDIL